MPGLLKKNPSNVVALLYACLILFCFIGNATAQDEVALEVITVEPSQPDWIKLLSPGAVSVVTPDDFAGEQKNLAEMLDQVPGLFVQRVTGTGQYTTISIRGSTASQVNVYVDGILQNLGNDIAVDVSLIPVSQVARIEVYRGYVPVRFAGSPIGGVVNIVTKKADTLGVTAEVGTRSLGGQTYTLTATAPTFWDGSLLLGAHYDSADNDFRFARGNSYGGKLYYRPDWNRVQWRVQNHNTSQDFLLKWQNDNFSLKAGYKETERALPGMTWFQDKGVVQDVAIPYQVQDVKHTDLVLGYNNTWGDFDFGLQFHYLKQEKDTQLHDEIKYDPHGNAGRTKAPGDVWSNRDTERLGGQLDFSYKWSDRNLFEFHADHSKEELKVKANDWTGGDAGLFPDIPHLYPVYNEKRTHIQAQNTISLDNAKSTKLSLAYRMDKVESTGNERENDSWRDSWGIALIKDINENFSFRATYGTFNRFPNFTERFGDGLNVIPSYVEVTNPFFPPLTWEEGDQWDVGLDWRGEFLGAGGSASVTYFNRYTENMMVMSVNQKFLYFTNAGLGTVEGVEFETALSWDNFDLNLATTWQQGSSTSHHFRGGTTSMTDDSKLPNLPQWRHFARGNYRFSGDSLSIYAEYHYLDEIYRELTGAGDPIAQQWIIENPLQLINVGLHWKITDKISLTAGVNDLLNKGVTQGTTSENVANWSQYSKGRAVYGSVVDYTRPGRTYFTTLRYEFGGHESSGEAATPAAGGNFSNIDEIGEDSSFYIAPKIIYSKLNTAFSGDNNFGFGGGPDGTAYEVSSPGAADVFRDVWMRANSMESQTLPGGNNGTSGAAFALAAGIDLYKLYDIPIRLELEGSLNTRRNQGYKGDTLGPLRQPSGAAVFGLSEFTATQNLQTDLSTLFLNGYIDWHNSTRFTPYIGGGLGFTRYKHKLTQELDLTYKEDDNDLPWGGAPTWDSAVAINWKGAGAERFDRTTEGWDFTWNLAVGFSYQLTPATHIDFAYRYVDYGEHKVSSAIPDAIIFDPTVPANNGGGSVVMYTHTNEQTVKMDSHQAMLTLRFDMGAGLQTIADFNRKTKDSISLFGDFSGLGLLDNPAIKAVAISPHLGGFFPSSDFGLENGTIGGLSLGYNFTRNWGIEASYDITNHASSNVDNRLYTGSTRVHSARLNAVYHVVDPENDLSRWVPYVTAGVGMVWSKGNFEDHLAYKGGIVAVGNGYKNNQPTGDYQSFAVNVGIGTKYFLTENIALRLEVLDTYAFEDADFGRYHTVGPYHNLAVTGGLTFQFGETR